MSQHQIRPAYYKQFGQYFRAQGKTDITVQEMAAKLQQDEIGASPKLANALATLLVGTCGGKPYFEGFRIGLKVEQEDYERFFEKLTATQLESQSPEESFGPLLVDDAFLQYREPGHNVVTRKSLERGVLKHFSDPNATNNKVFQSLFAIGRKLDLVEDLTKVISNLLFAVGDQSPKDDVLSIQELHDMAYEVVRETSPGKGSIASCSSSTS